MFGLDAVKKIISYLISLLVVSAIAFVMGRRSVPPRTIPKRLPPEHDRYVIIQPLRGPERIKYKKIKVPEYIIDTITDTLTDTILQYIDLHTGIKFIDIKRDGSFILRFFRYDTLFGAHGTINPFSQTQFSLAKKQLEIHDARVGYFIWAGASIDINKKINPYFNLDIYPDRNIKIGFELSVEPKIKLEYRLK